MSLYLKSMRLVNIQSWKDTTISLCDGLNVVPGPNNTGKSVIFKAFKIVVTPDSFDKSDRLDIIRKGCSDGRVYYLFSDNSLYMTIVTAKENRYYKSDDMTVSTNLEYLGCECPKDLVNKLGAITDGNIIANLIDMDQNMFLVNSDDNVNFGILKLLTQNENIEKIKHNLINERIPRARDLSSKALSARLYTEKLLSHFKFVDLKGKEETIKFFSSLTNPIECCINSSENLELIKEYKDVSKYTESLLEVANGLYETDLLLDSVGSHKVIPQSYNSEIDLIDRFNNVYDDLDNINEFKDFNICNDKLNAIDVLHNVLNDVNYVKSYMNVNSDLLTLVEGLSELYDAVDKLHSLGDTVLKNKELDDSIKDLGGTEYECPIYGKITFINEECIH